MKKGRLLTCNGRTSETLKILLLRSVRFSVKYFMEKGVPMDSFTKRTQFAPPIPSRYPVNS